MLLYQIHPSDTVAVALSQIEKGTTVPWGSTTITAQDEIPVGHKLAIAPIHAGDTITKYGMPIGHATTDIAPGSHVHSHNLASDLCGQLSYTYAPHYTELPKRKPETFLGYRRANGSVGIRNAVWIVPTVGCVNGVVREIEKRAQGFKTAHIDEITAFCHPYGCSQLGNDQARTLAFLAGLVRHPHAAAVLVVGLGCENGHIEALKEVLGTWDNDRVRFLVAQDVVDEVEEGVRLVQELCQIAEEDRRTVCSAAELVIGLKCGGSDGFSGITANPLVGQLTDRLVAMGGSAILTEVPEMFGAEKLLMRRCRSEEQFISTVALINDFKAYFERYGERTDENPSPGNKAGGITTLAEKSLGCTQKGGTAPIEDVLRYAEPIRKKGLSLLQAPGNDLVASDALAISGAQLVLFTTGRGTPFGCVVPTMKIATNTALYERKRHWIDFDAGELLRDVPMDTLTDRLFAQMLAVASGEVHTHAETLEGRELAIFKDGVTL